jgi:hypothetical protein
VKWQAPLTPTGVSERDAEHRWFARLMARPMTPHSLFNGFHGAVNASISNAMSTTTLSGLNATGCAPNSLMHLQGSACPIRRSDTYEGYVYVNGVGLQFGVQ